MSCYEQFGWTPDDCKRILDKFPMEAELLAVYFEELGSFRGEQHADMIRKQGETADPGWHTDQVFEDDDE